MFSIFGLCSSNRDLLSPRLIDLNFLKPLCRPWFFFLFFSLTVLSAYSIFLHSKSNVISLIVNGPTEFSEHWNNPEVTAATLHDRCYEYAVLSKTPRALADALIRITVLRRKK